MWKEILSYSLGSEKEELDVSRQSDKRCEDFVQLLLGRMSASLQSSARRTKPL